MKELFIICHKDHLVSGSVRFVETLFSREFNVRVIPYEGGLKYIELIRISYPQAVYVLWQTEFVAPWLCAHGCKVITVPMYDGCANAPVSYFRLLDNAHLISFSNDLHKKCLEAGIVSYPVTYYPDLAKSKKRITRANRLFYWRRRPNSLLSELNVKDFFAPYVEKIHIHDRPDSYKLSRHTSATADDITSTSDWFKDKQQLTDLIRSSRFYLAPREAEGIGMAFLEAMSFGCIVFANRNSTHNQYIYHGRNGFLIDFESYDIKLIKAQIAEAFAIIRSGVPIGENAARFIKNGVPIWKAQSKQILNMVVALGGAGSPAPYTKREKAAAYILAAVNYKHAMVHYIMSVFVVWIGIFAPRTGEQYMYIVKPLKFLRKIRRSLRRRRRK